MAKNRVKEEHIVHTCKTIFETDLFINSLKAKERYGREKYLMKAANEDIYVIKQQENTLSQTE